MDSTFTIEMQAAALANDLRQFARTRPPLLQDGRVSLILLAALLGSRDERPVARTDRIVKQTQHAVVRTCT